MQAEELRLKLLRIRDGSAEVCKAAEEALAMLPSPDESQRGYEGDVVGHLRSIAENGAGREPDNADRVEPRQ